MKRLHIPVLLVALATLGSGIINLYSVIGPALPHRMKTLEAFFPLEFIHVARFVTLLIGFALVISAINIYKRKRRAYLFVLYISFLSIVFHLTKGLDYEEAMVSLVLLALLYTARSRFTVRSSVPDMEAGLVRIAAALLLALAYGVSGFWLLDRREFGIDFRLGDAIRETFAYLSFAGDPELVSRTRYARWFLDSLFLVTGTAIVYGLYALFRPALYRFRTRPRERLLAKAIVEKHGRSSLDFFKFWPDKSYYFSPSRRGFVAFRVGNHFALALADPVGPEKEIEGIISGYAEFCRENDWGAGFHQTLPDFLPVYEKLGFRKIKVGDDAIVNLERFSLDGKERKAFRHVVNKLEEEGIAYRWYEPPLSDEVLDQAEEVSDAWLRIAGRKERRFTLGSFDPGYIRSAPLAAAFDAAGKMLAFANQIPSYRAGETTIDLMRHRPDAPAGVMDYLFVKLFLQMKEKGFARFSLGLAPMSGFRENENASVEEKAIHSFFQHLNFLFSYRGLKRYKAKFADVWEPRYSIYRTPLDLARMALALSAVSDMKHAKSGDIESPAEEEEETLPEDTAPEQP
jgi:phosphatidylglycerol lysyltransferase